MGMLLRFPHQTSARSRAAKSAKISRVTPASLAAGKETIADHHSGGMLLRCHHFETTQSPAPRSVRNASRVGHSSITVRNDVIDMRDFIGRCVLKRKPQSSLDERVLLGHTVLMVKAKNKRQQIIERTAILRIRAGVSQQQVADALNIRQDTYKNYETKRPLPQEYVEVFCTVCRIEPNELFGWPRRRAIA